MNSSSHAAEGGLRRIQSAAPLRILDNGGWTDTWFAHHGRVFNVAVSPFAQVKLETFAAEGEPVVRLSVENYNDEYTFVPGSGKAGRHPLLEAAIEHVGIPPGVSLLVSTFCEVPAGASTGTSAAMLVALIAALLRMRDMPWTAEAVATSAHYVEMNVLKRQCGIQDHIASAYGGINYIEVTEFPRATVTSLVLPEAILRELERRIVLIYLGKTHDSAEMHGRVIRSLEHAGPDCKMLQDLRVAADRARDACLAGDLRALGRAMIDNTEAQQRLHADLVSADALRVIRIARSHGAFGWKVNGAGGEGGTVTLLCQEGPSEQGPMIAAIESATGAYQHIPVRLIPSGVRAWE